MTLRPLLIFLCLCHLGRTEEPSVSPGSTNASDTTEENVHSCGGGHMFSPENHRKMGGAIEQLGLELLQKLPVGPKEPNIVVSPLSLAFALAHLTLGARNETERLLLNSLHADSLSCYHHVLGSFMPHFSNTTLEVAARMYLRPGFEVKLSFVEESLARYQSQPVPLPSVEEVNSWVENATNGQIPNFLESIPHNVVLMLINAVYFKDQWQTTFDAQATSKGLFYLDTQNSVSVDMMKSAQYPLRLMYDTELDAQVASFAFKGNTSFLVVKPLLNRQNVSSVIPKLNISKLYNQLSPEMSMQVTLPKVKLHYRQELQEALTKMGLGPLFSGPDLSGISDHPLKVSSIRHASTIELNEEGVEASATTAISHLRSISQFTLNSPFVFALIDDASLTPLFMGIVTNPAPDNDAMLNDDPHSNSTMSDQPVMHSQDSRDSKHNFCNKTEAEGDSGTQRCHASNAENQQLHQANGLEEGQDKKSASN